MATQTSTSLPIARVKTSRTNLARLIVQIDSKEKVAAALREIVKYYDRKKLLPPSCEKRPRGCCS